MVLTGDLLAHPDLATSIETSAPFRGRNGRPSSRPMLAQEVIDDYKRGRAVEAIARLVHERGWGGLTATGVIKEMRVGRATFYELFGTREGACRFACDSARRRLLEPMEAAAQAGGRWPGPLRRGLAALLAAVAADPPRAELCLVHAATLERRPDGQPQGLHDPQTVAALAALLATGRAAGPTDLQPSDREHFLAAAIVSVIARRLRGRAPESLPGLDRELVGLVTASDL